MKDFIILKFFDLFAGLFKLMGVDYNHFRLIIQTKLNLDRRRVPSMMRNMKVNPKKDQNLFARSFFFYIFMGLMLGGMATVSTLYDLFLGETIFYTMMSLMLTNVFILEFSIDIFDVSDRDILYPLPISQKTVNLAKNVHIMLYMLAITFAFTLPYSILLGILKNIPIALVTMVTSILLLLFIFFIASILFGFLIRKFSGEKLKDIVNWVQIVMMLGAFLGFQLFNQVYSSTMLKSGLEGIREVIYFFPPSWFATIPSLLETSSFNLKNILFASLTILLSVAGYLAYIKLIAPAFERNLYKLTITEKSITKVKPPRAMKYSSLFKSNLVKSFYEFSIIMLSRERKLKQAIYPLLVMGIFFPLLTIYRSVSDENFLYADSKLYLFLYYLVMMVIPLSVYVRYSDSFKSAWIYRFLPIKNPGDIIKAAQFAIFFTFQLPVVLLASIIFLVVWKFTIIPHILAFILASIIIQLIYQKFTDHIMPFSQELKTAQTTAFRQGSYFLTILVFIPILVGVHLLATLFPNAIYLYIVLQVLTVYLLYRNHFNISWDEIKG